MSSDELPKDLENGLDVGLSFDGQPQSGLNQDQFDKAYGRIVEEPKTCKERAESYVKKNMKCSKSCCKNFLLSQFPIINVVRTYKVKEYILGDVFSGISLGILNIPQGMGYALLAAVGPANGLYTSLFAPLIYALFGTSRHIAMGVMALSSLLLAEIVKRETLHLQEAIEVSTGNETAALEAQLMEESVQVCILVTVLCGVFSFIMGVVKLGFLTDYLGEAFLAGFLVGATLRVITSQLLQILQIHVHPYIGTLAFIYTVIDIFTHITTANIAAIVIAIISMIIILTVKYAVNERFQSKLKVPVPIEFILVVILTIACYFGKFESRFGVRVIKHIPSGFPRPSVPPFHRAQDFIVDAFIMALIGYILAYMMAKIFSQRHHYSCDANQEFKAIGLCNMIGGFFSCIPMSSSPPRCFLMEQTGGKTQVANIISGLIVMIFLFFAGPLLEPMPICILNVLIIAACLPIFQYCKLLIVYWHANKYDLAIWLVTAVSMIFLTMDLSIIIGVAFSLLTVVFRNQKPYSKTLSPVENNTALVDPSKYSRYLKVLPTTKIFQFSSPLYFVTMPVFKQCLFSSVVSPDAMLKDEREHRRMELEVFNDVEQNPEGDVEVGDGLSTPLTTRKQKMADSTDEKKKLEHIIVDASAVPFADTGAVKMLALMRKQYNNVGIEFYVAGCNEGVRQQLMSVTECGELCKNALFPTVQDALVFCQ